MNLFILVFIHIQHKLISVFKLLSDKLVNHALPWLLDFDEAKQCWTLGMVKRWKYQS